MNKKIALATLILTAGFALTACTPPSTANDNRSPNPQATDEQTTTTILNDSEITTTTTDSETTDGNLNAEGGNPDIAGYVEVTVSEDKYFYENHEISFDELMEVLDGLEENTAVRISDDNAALKDFENLTKALEERSIIYEVVS